MSTKIEILIGQHVEYIGAPNLYIKDEQGRVGVVTEVRDGGRVIFARPSDAPEQLAVSGVVAGVFDGALITSTPWHRGGNGKLTGSWYDEPTSTPNHIAQKHDPQATRRNDAQGTGHPQHP